MREMCVVHRRLSSVPKEKGDPASASIHANGSLNRVVETGELYSANRGLLLCLKCVPRSLAYKDTRPRLLISRLWRGRGGSSFRLLIRLVHHLTVDFSIICW